MLAAEELKKNGAKKIPPKKQHNKTPLEICGFNQGCAEARGLISSQRDAIHTTESI
jgi:hypothetical protein